MTKKGSNRRKYSIGVDIGTSSVGWSVTDSYYHLLKKGNKNLWGVRLFDEAETAAKRRISRTSKRRLNRKKQRIALLKLLVGNEVLKVEPSFFMKLEKGYATKQDKGYDYNLFNDPEFTDKEYYKQFKTIYHLRKYLCETSEKIDPRLLYLALHHIFKHRGNFLYEGQKFVLSDLTNVNEKYQRILEKIFEANGVEFALSLQEIQESFLIFMDQSKRKSEKKEEVMKLLSKNDNRSKAFIKEFVCLLVGSKANITKLFSNVALKKEGEDFSTTFSSDAFNLDEKFLEEELGEFYEVLCDMQNVYSAITLNDIMQSEKSISNAMVKKYEQHKHDLEQLKDIIRMYYPNDFNTVFRSTTQTGNYQAYINNVKKTPKVDAFYKFIKKQLSKNEVFTSTDTYKTIMERIENETYLSKQTSIDNGAIPYQLHEQELVTILENQSKFYPEIAKNYDKILSVFKFRVPYYVGPLNRYDGNNNNNPFSWFVRKEEGKIYPWNFNEKVDSIASAEAFIHRMLNCCTYLIHEPVLPKNSLLYSKYEVLNELNKIRVKGRLFDVKTKLDIIETVFKKHKKIKDTHIWDYCIRHGLVNQNDEIDVQGFQKEHEFSSSLEPWIDFQNIFGEDFLEYEEDIEKIIEWISVYEDKKILKQRLESEFPKWKHYFKQIVKLNYKGWGRLSKKLLSGITVRNQYGDSISIMNCLEDTQFNFMQIINDKKLGFDKQIEKEMNFHAEESTISYKLVSELPGSPAIKKGIWQTSLIIKEIVKYMGCDPEHIFIEFARSDDKKKRTISQVKKLQDIYESLKEEEFLEGIQDVYNNVKSLDKSKAISERLYLYYIQQGKCMYSGEPLELDQLSSYQIDHILPQSYVKDDSFENKVLVKARQNQNKNDALLLKKEIVDKQYQWWKYLKTMHFIGDKKFKNLIRTHISEREEMGFVNRQLVETRQITKHVANLLSNAYKTTQIVSIKANLLHEFREKFELYKIRELNDYHHAHDAYLACMIGTFVMKKYPVLKKEFIFTEYNQMGDFKKDMSSMRQAKSKYSFVISQLNDCQRYNNETGEIIWDESTLNSVLNVFNYRDCFITKKQEERNGQLFNLTIKKKEEIKKTISEMPHKVIAIKKDRSDITQYGGYIELKSSYGIAVEYTKKNKLRREVLNVPSTLANAEQAALIKYLKADVKSDNITILKDKILFNQLIEIEGCLYTMASATEFNNAQQLILSKQSQKTIYELFNDKLPEPSLKNELALYDEYCEKLNLYYPHYKSIYDKLIKLRSDFIKSVEKSRIMKELLNISKANASNGALDIDSFKMSARVGRLSSKIVNLDKTTFIYQSVTGIYEKKQKL